MAGRDEANAAGRPGRPGRQRSGCIGRKEGLGYRQGLAGTQLPTYHKHKGSAWPRTASQGGPRSKAGLLFNYLIHNRWHCIRLSRRGGLLSRALIEAFNTPVRVGRETASASTPPPTNSLNCKKKGGEVGPQGYLYYTLIDPKWRITHRRGEKDLRTFNRRVALCSRPHRQETEAFNYGIAREFLSFPL